MFCSPRFNLAVRPSMSMQVLIFLKRTLVFLLQAQQTLQEPTVMTFIMIHSNFDILHQLNCSCHLEQIHRACPSRFRKSAGVLIYKTVNLPTASSGRDSGGKTGSIHPQTNKAVTETECHSDRNWKLLYNKLWGRFVLMLSSVLCVRGVVILVTSFVILWPFIRRQLVFCMNPDPQPAFCDLV